MVGEAKMKIGYNISIQKQLIFRGDSNFQLSFIPFGITCQMDLATEKKNQELIPSCEQLFFSLRTVQKKA